MFIIVFSAVITCPAPQVGVESRTFNNRPTVCRLRRARFHVFIFSFKRPSRLVGTSYGISPPIAIGASQCVTCSSCSISSVYNFLFSGNPDNYREESRNPDSYRGASLPVRFSSCPECRQDRLDFIGKFINGLFDQFFSQ
jgi:hypothetical protein